MRRRTITRSRSRTPGPWGDDVRDRSSRRSSSVLAARSRRAIISQLVDEQPNRRPEEDEPEPRLWIPPSMTSSSFWVEKTPGGTLRPGCPGPPVVRTPGGHVRPKTVLEESIHMTVVERAEALGLEQEEGHDLVHENLDHVRKWVSEVEAPRCPDVRSRVCRTPEPVVDFDAPGTSGVQAGEQSRPGPSGINRSSLSTTEPVAVLPSTSGRTAMPRGRFVFPAAPGSDVDSEYDDLFDIENIVDTAVAGRRDREIPVDEELDEGERNILDSIGNAMDEAIDRLPGISSDYTWQRNFDTFTGVQELFSGPTPGPIKDYDTPYDAFVDIWDKGIMEHIVRETNRYAKQELERLRPMLKATSRLCRWTETDVDEMYVFLALHIFMGLTHLTSQHEYWKKTGYPVMPRFREIMSYDRYILINRFVHFSDNSVLGQNLPEGFPAESQDLTSENSGLRGDTSSGRNYSSKLAKLAPVLRHLNSKFSTLYNLEQDIAVDESLTLFKGRLSWIQAIRSKAARFGIKSYELCESRTGYLSKFDIYTGKNSERDGDIAPSVDLAGKSTQVVLTLLKGLERRGHCVTMDNFYNSPALARYLKSLGFDCLGTLRSSRRNVPIEIAKVPKNVAKGTIVALHSGDISCIAWKDTKVVTMISTYHDSGTYVGRKAGRELVKPIVVKDYNSTMGGIDLKDQKLSMYLLERKRCVKWYMKLFKRLLNVSVHNSLIMLLASLKRRGTPIITHRCFRERLAESLVEIHGRRPPLPAIPVSIMETRLRMDVHHFPKHLTTRDRRLCMVCRRKGIDRKVQLHCIACNESLCFEPCWREWHTLQRLEGREIVVRKRRRSP